MRVISKPNVNPIEEYNMQDPSSNAMTEVALGLCMAFFSLLVLALISIGLPSAIDMQNQQQSAIQKLVQASKMQFLTQSEQDEHNTPITEEQKIVIYWSGSFMDIHKNILTPESLATMDNIVIAVDPAISFSELLDLQKDVAGKHIQLTSLTDEWLHSFDSRSNATSK